MSQDGTASASQSSLRYRPCAGMMVLNKEGLVWVGRRADGKNEAEGPGTWWQMPQGGIDDTENAEAAARRELIEETSMRSVGLLAERSDWITYELPPEIAGRSWGGQYRGQKQRWFAFRFTGPDSEINIIPPAGHKAEFIAWRWAAMDELEGLVVPFKRAVYAEVVAGFAHLAKVKL